MASAGDNGVHSNSAGLGGAGVKPDCTLPHLCVRGNEGLYLYETGGKNAFRAFHVDSEAQTKRSNNQVYSWSQDGKYLAWCNSECVLVLDVTNDFNVVLQLPKPRAIQIEFSPLNTYISTFEVFSNANQGKDNINVFSFLTGNLVATFTQGTSDNWKPQFSLDEKICCRFTKEGALFFENANFTKPARRLTVAGLGNVEMCPKSPNCVAVYQAGKKGSPSMVKLLTYPELNIHNAISSKSFFKGDNCQLIWNELGTGCIIKSMTEVDQSGNAYYGETTLYHLSTDGSAGLVELNKVGPIYDVCWDPTRNEFCVVFGHMPSKACLFNSNCDSIYDFGTGLRTACRYTPQGHMMAIYGHGGVRSNVEIWHRKSLSLVAKIMDFQDITYFDWSPCGERVLLATVSPTLKVDNKWVVYDYLGKKIHCDLGKQGLPAGERGGAAFEFWQVRWQKKLKQDYPAKDIKFTPISLKDLKVQEVTAKKYVPPHMRNKNGGNATESKNIVLDLNDLPDKEREAALKGGKGHSPKSTPGGHQITYQTGKPNVDSSGKGGSAKAAAPPKCTIPGADLIVRGEQGGDKAKKNRIKTLEKRMKEIKGLKEKQSQGSALEGEALKKVNRESEIKAELERLRNS